MENLVHTKKHKGSVNLKKQEVMKATRQDPARGHERPEELTNVYLGYINGRMAHFILKYIPSSNQYVKVEV